MTASFPENEKIRLDALRHYAILDTAPEPVFDDLAKLAAQICRTPVGLVSLVDAHRQWFKAHFGLDFRETERGFSFCAHAILNPDIFEIADTHLDERFASNPLVRSYPRIRFYAGMPLVTSEGAAIGTLSVIDIVPRRLSEDQRNALRVLASQVIAQLELRRQGLETVDRLRDEVAASKEALEETAKRYRSLFHRNLAGAYRSTVDGRLLECNAAFARILGYDSPEEMVQIPTWDLYFSHEDREHSIKALREQGELANFELRLRRRDGTPVWVIENESLLEGESDQQIEGTIVDITDRKLAEERVQHQAYHDFLTDLPNRLLFGDRLELAIAHASRSGKKLAVLFLDLDHFKLINDTMAHAAGDDLLRSVATRLQGAVRQDDTVARMGGDEFTILLPEVNGEEGAAKITRKILQLFHEPFNIHGREIYITASLGIAVFPNDGDDAATLVKNADSAMYRAKDMGRDNFQFYMPMAQKRAEERLTLETALRRALERNQFFLEYQPQLNVGTGKIVGVEALLRWRHPEHGVIPPYDFIPLAEEIGLILPLGEWVLHEACAQVRKWHQSGYSGLRVAVNLSARQFQHPGLAFLVERVLEETSLEPENLELEITESLAMKDGDYTFATLSYFRKLGIRLSIDDFGTGYSSLNYLKILPIHALKIDQAFIREISTKAVDRAIVKAVIEMAHSLELTTVAEGVEFKDQKDVLETLGCDEFQGFLISRAIGPSEMTEFLSGCESGRL